MVESSGFNPRAREGATMPRMQTAKMGQVSIHAPVKARLEGSKTFDKRTERFNPRAREGATPQTGRLRFSMPVSIHAPVKARPQGWARRNAPLQEFQSTR